MSNQIIPTPVPQGIGLSIGQIVLEHAQFAHRPDYLQYAPTSLADTQLATDVQIRVLEGVLASGDHTPGRAIAGVTVRVITKETDPPPLYQFDVAVTALVIANSSEATIPPLEFIGQSGFATLFPFVRETVANLTMRGRFGPIWLPPINIRSAVVEAVADLRKLSENKAPVGAVKSTAKSSKKKSSAK